MILSFGCGSAAVRSFGAFPPFCSRLRPLNLQPLPPLHQLHHSLDLRTHRRLTPRPPRHALPVAPAPTPVFGGLHRGPGGLLRLAALGLGPSGFAQRPLFAHSPDPLRQPLPGLAQEKRVPARLRAGPQARRASPRRRLALQLRIPCPPFPATARPSGLACLEHLLVFPLVHWRQLPLPWSANPPRARISPWVSDLPGPFSGHRPRRHRIVPATSL